jgi:hypothetical protein
MPLGQPVLYAGRVSGLLGRLSSDLISCVLSPSQRLPEWHVVQHCFGSTFI